MAPVIERVTPSLTLGEGPHWDAATQSLYLVDIFGKSIHRYVPATKKFTTAAIDSSSVSIILPVEGERNKFIIATGRNLTKISWDGESESVSILENVVEVENEPETVNNNFNDGKCDASGRIWVGTMGPMVNGVFEPEKGSLYSVDNQRNIKKHATKIGVANGLTWSPDNKYMYYIDTHTSYLEKYDFDIQNGTIKNKQIIFNLSKHDIPGGMDGMTVDTDGNLWIAIFGGSRIIKVDPTKPETLLDTITLPAKQVTSLAFGGSNLDELYVTTASLTIGGVELSPPDHGATYKITGLGVKGFAGISAKI